MAVTAHVYPNAVQLLTQKAIDWQGGTVDTIKVLLATGTYAWNATSEAHTTVTQFLAGSGAGALTETSGTGYSRLSLSSVAVATSGLYTSLTAASPIQWTSATFSASYALFYDYTAGGGSDTAGVPICYWDLGGTQSCSNGSFTLTLGTGLPSVANCLIQFTAS